MDKKSFIIYQNWATLFENLEDEKAGMLIKAICAYSNGKEVEIQDVSINAVFQMIAEKLSEDGQKYAETVKKRADAVNKRWQKNKEEIQNDTNEYISIQKNTKVEEKIQNDSDTDTDTDTDNNLKEKNNKKRKFVPPTLEEVKAYCKTRGNNVDAEAFINFYTSKDWMIGKNKMKDWQAAVRTWEKNQKDRASPDNKYINFEERTIDFDDLERRFAKN